jgi:hypothetical protein
LYDLKWKESEGAVRAEVRRSEYAMALRESFVMGLRVSLSAAAIWVVVCLFMLWLTPRIEMKWWGVFLAIVVIPQAFALQAWNTMRLATPQHFRITERGVRKRLGEPGITWRKVAAYSVDQVAEGFGEYTLVHLWGKDGERFRMVLPDEPLARRVLTAIEHYLPGRKVDGDPFAERRRDRFPFALAVGIYTGTLLAAVPFGWLLARWFLAGHVGMDFLAVLAVAVLVPCGIVAMVLYRRWNLFPKHCAVWAFGVAFISGGLTILFFLIFWCHEKVTPHIEETREWRREARIERPEMGADASHRIWFTPATETQRFRQRVGAGGNARGATTSATVAHPGQY